MAYTFKKLTDVLTNENISNNDKVFINSDNTVKQIDASKVGTVVEASEERATGIDKELKSIKVNDELFNIPEGTVVEAANETSSEEELKGIKIGDAEYKIASDKFEVELTIGISNDSDYYDVQNSSASPDEVYNAYKNGKGVTAKIHIYDNTYITELDCVSEDGGYKTKDNAARMKSVEFNFIDINDAFETDLTAPRCIINGYIHDTPSPVLKGKKLKDIFGDAPSGSYWELLLVPTVDIPITLYTDVEGCHEHIENVNEQSCFMINGTSISWRELYYLFYVGSAPQDNPPLRLMVNNITYNINDVTGEWNDDFRIDISIIKNDGGTPTFIRYRAFTEK